MRIAWKKISLTGAPGAQIACPKFQDIRKRDKGKANAKIKRSSQSSYVLAENPEQASAKNTSVKFV